MKAGLLLVVALLLSVEAFVQAEGDGDGERSRGIGRTDVAAKQQESLARGCNVFSIISTLVKGTIETVHGCWEFTMLAAPPPSLWGFVLMPYCLFNGAILIGQVTSELVASCFTRQ